MTAELGEPGSCKSLLPIVVYCDIAMVAPIPEPMHDPIFPKGDPIEPYPIGAEVKQFPFMAFIAELIAPMFDAVKTPFPKDPPPLPCGDTDDIPVIPIVFIVYVGVIGLMFPLFELGLLLLFEFGFTIPELLIGVSAYNFCIALSSSSTFINSKFADISDAKIIVSFLNQRTIFIDQADLQLSFLHNFYSLDYRFLHREFVLKSASWLAFYVLIK